MPGAKWSAEARREHVPVLVQPDGPFLFAGEHVSDLPGWQEGAVLSAHRAVASLADLAAAR